MKNRTSLHSIDGSAFKDTGGSLSIGGHFHKSTEGPVYAGITRTVLHLFQLSSDSRTMPLYPSTFERREIEHTLLHEQHGMGTSYQY